MKRFLLSILLTLSLLASSCTASNLKPTQHAAAHQIMVTGKSGRALCSAVAIAPHVLLTAEHCDDKDASFVVDGEQNPQAVSKKLYDNQDHMLLVMPNANFVSVIQYEPTTYLKGNQGEHIYFWGNPAVDYARLQDQYREGYVTGICQKQYTKEEDGINASGYFFIIAVVGGRGDSGAAVFSEDGRFVGIVSYGLAKGAMLGIFPMAFTPEQVAEAEK